MPFQLSTRGRYGLRLMVSLALDYGGGVTLLKELSRREGISEKYLGQIVIPLKNAGLISSQRGSRGGYALARPPETVTVKDVVEAIEGKISPVPCVDDPESCSRVSSCVAGRVWKRLGEEIEKSLSSVTLAALAQQARELSGAAGEYVI